MRETSRKPLRLMQGNDNRRAWRGRQEAYRSPPCEDAGPSPEDREESEDFEGRGGSQRVIDLSLYEQHSGYSVESGFGRGLSGRGRVEEDGPLASFLPLLWPRSPALNLSPAFQQKTLLLFPLMLHLLTCQFLSAERGNPGSLHCAQNKVQMP